ncbi:MAG: 7-cyano-7-deazaguanine synthase [Thermoplasmatota archaeon]
MSVVCLVSGGIDSLVMSKFLEKEGEEILPIFIDYGQLANSKEWHACKIVFDKVDLPQPTKIDLSGFGNIFKSGITDSNKDIYDDAFIPGRNLLFLTVAASYAYINNLNKIAIGLLSEENHMFPDQTEEFIVNANVAVNSALNTQFTILTPLINFTKDEVIKLAEDFELPLELTYSCHQGKEKYCGDCVACKEIIDSMGLDFFENISGGEK